MGMWLWFTLAMISCCWSFSWPRDMREIMKAQPFSLFLSACCQAVDKRKKNCGAELQLCLPGFCSQHSDWRGPFAQLGRLLGSLRPAWAGEFELLIISLMKERILPSGVFLVQSLKRRKSPLHLWISTQRDIRACWPCYILFPLLI